jgi:hypothetical protein
MPKTYVHRASVHMGGPQPMVPRSAQHEIVLWCAETALPYVRPSDRERLALVLRDVRASGGLDAQGRIQLQRALDDVARVPEEDPLRFAGLVSAVLKREHISARNTVRTARAAVTRMVRLLELYHVSPLPFLHALDERLLRAELIGCAKRYCRDIDERLERVVHRGGDGKGDPVVWIARLRPRPGAPGPCWGALARRVGFHWSEGTRGDALAIVPDDHLEAATAAAFASGD